MTSTVLNEYLPHVGMSVVEELLSLSQPLKGRKILMINSTKDGGGVAELLHGMLPIFKELGLEAEWLDLKGNAPFFDATKRFHNALQGGADWDVKEQIAAYEQFYDEHLHTLNSHILDYLSDLSHQDIIVVHDPQPLSLIHHRKEDGSKWVWRCHIDTADPHPELKDFVYDQVKKFDSAICSRQEFMLGDHLPWWIIPPSINPTTEKNRELSDAEEVAILTKYKIPVDKPFISQVSRFDIWKDPVGVIAAWRKSKEESDSRLLLVYNGASDDPEGDMMLQRVLKAKKGAHEEDVLLVRGDDPLLVNAIQRRSKAVLQKSLKEGFALTVSEALWKGTPVIATDVGGIPLQVQDGENGYLVKNYAVHDDGSPLDPKAREKHLNQVAACIVELLQKPEQQQRMGNYGKEWVRKHFLVTRHVKDYLELFNSLYKERTTKSDVVITA